MSAKPRCAEKSQDERILVLLVFGLGISLLHWAGCLPPVTKPVSANTSSTGSHYYIWPETSGIPTGLFYFSSPAPLSEKDLQTWMGMHAEGVIRDTSESVTTLVENCLLSCAPLEPYIAPLFFQPVSINRAPPEVLATLPGIGEKLAARIVAYREKHGPFRQPADLLQVNGIGPGKFRGVAGQFIID